MSMQGALGRQPAASRPVDDDEGIDSASEDGEALLAIADKAQAATLSLALLSDTSGLHWRELVGANQPADSRASSKAVQLPKADVLVHAGDFSKVGRADEVQSFVRWLREVALPQYKYVILVPGNMDGVGIEGNDERVRMLSHEPGVVYLEHRAIKVLGVKFFGSPFTIQNRGGFQSVQVDGHAAQLWQDIPDDTDVVVTHEAPYGILDSAPHRGGANRGDRSLLHAIKRVKPQVHVFGHVNNRGAKLVDGVQFVNAFFRNDEPIPVVSVLTDWDGRAHDDDDNEGDDEEYGDEDVGSDDEDDSDYDEDGDDDEDTSGGASGEK